MSQNVIPFRPQDATLEEIRLDSLRFPRLHALPEATALAQLQTSIYKAAALRNQPIPPETSAFMAASLREVLLQDIDRLGLPYLSMEEIKREIRAAALGARGEIYSISVASLYQAICAYAKGPGIRAAQEAQKRRQQDLMDAEDNGPISVRFERLAEVVKNALNTNK